MTDISLIIPYYNRQDTIQRTLESIASQTMLPREVILVDNNSSDQSGMMAKLFLERMQAKCGVKLVSCPVPGAAAARNKGLSVAAGEYVYFFDSDDEMSADFIEEAYRQIKEAPADLIVFRTRIILPTGQSYIRNHGFSTSPYYQILSPFLSTQTMLVRKEFLLQTGAWDENLFYWNDWELGIRLLQHSPRIRFVKGQPFHKIYAHADSITGNGYSSRVPQIKEALLKVYTDIQSAAMDVQKSLYALYFRKTIIVAQVKREGDARKAKEIESLPIPSEIPFVVEKMGKLLSLYIRMGGRGAWLVARYMLLLL